MQGVTTIGLDIAKSVLHRLTAALGGAARDALIHASNVPLERFPQQHRAEPDASRWAEVISILKGLARCRVPRQRRGRDPKPPTVPIAVAT
jgi:hypothetical protein